LLAGAVPVSGVKGVTQLDLLRAKRVAAVVVQGLLPQTQPVLELVVPLELQLPEYNRDILYIQMVSAVMVVISLRLESQALGVIITALGAVGQQIHQRVETQRQGLGRFSVGVAVPGKRQLVQQALAETVKLVVVVVVLPQTPRPVLQVALVETVS
jgi:hypothetical protein